MATPSIKNHDLLDLYCNSEAVAQWSALVQTICIMGSSIVSYIENHSIVLLFVISSLSLVRRLLACSIISNNIICRFT